MILEIAAIALCLIAVAAGTAWLMLTVQNRSQKPLLALLRQQQKYLVSHDLQVYQGLGAADWEHGKPYAQEEAEAKEPNPRDLEMRAEDLAREFQRLEGELVHTAEN